MVVGDDLVRAHPAVLDGLTKERLGTGGVAVITQQYVHDYTVLVNSPIQVPLLPFAEEKHFVHDQRLPTRRRRRTSAASKGPNTWAQVRIVRCETSMPRSASNSRTCRLESGYARYQRTAVMMTSLGQR